MFGRKEKLVGSLLVTTIVLLVFSTTVMADAQLATSVIGSAGGRASSANFTMKSTLGQSTPIGSSSSTNFEVGAGFWYQDPVAPSAIGDLTATLSISDVVLEWSRAGDNVAVDHYVVYRATDPYFEPASGDSIGGTKGAIYLDTGAAKDTLTNFFYLVKAVDPSRNLAEDSNRVGEFDISTINVSGGK